MVSDEALKVYAAWAIASGIRSKTEFRDWFRGRGKSTAQQRLFDAWERITSV